MLTVWLGQCECCLRSIRREEARNCVGCAKTACGSCAVISGNDAWCPGCFVLWQCEQAIWELVRLWRDAAYVGPYPHLFTVAWVNIRNAVYSYVFPQLRSDTLEYQDQVFGKVERMVRQALIAVQYPGYQDYVRR